MLLKNIKRTRLYKEIEVLLIFLSQWSKLLRYSTHELRIRFQSGRISLSGVNISKRTQKIEDEFNRLYRDMPMSKWIEHVIKNRSNLRFVIFQSQYDYAFVQFSTLKGSLLLDIPDSEYNQRNKIVDKAVKILRKIDPKLKYEIDSDDYVRFLSVDLTNRENLARILVEEVLENCYRLKNYSLRVDLG